MASCSDRPFRIKDLSWFVARRAKQSPIELAAADPGHLGQTKLGQNRLQRLHNPIALEQPGGDLSEQLAPPVDRDVIVQRQRRPRLAGSFEALAVINVRLLPCHGLTIPRRPDASSTTLSSAGIFISYHGARQQPPLFVELKEAFIVTMAQLVASVMRGIEAAASSTAITQLWLSS